MLEHWFHYEFFPETALLRYDIETIEKLRNEWYMSDKRSLKLRGLHFFPPKILECYQFNRKVSIF